MIKNNIFIWTGKCLESINDLESSKDLESDSGRDRQIL